MAHAETEDHAPPGGLVGVGVISPKDHDFLKQAGVSAIYGPGTNIPHRRRNPLIDPEAARGSVKDPASDGSKSVLESSHFSEFAEHLVDFACVKLLGIDHLSGVLLDND